MREKARDKCQLKEDSRFACAASILAVILLAVRHDVVQVVVGPIDELAHQGQERAAALGESVFDTRRHLGIDGAAHQTVGLQTAQGLREHLLRAVGVLPFYVLEAHRGIAAAKGVDDSHRPLVADACQHVTYWALGEYGVLYEVFLHKSDMLICLMLWI